MPLSEHEQRLLEQMEKALYAEDPKFATSLRSTPTARAARGRAALGVVVLLAGVGLLVAGVAVDLAALGVAGFLAMLVGAVLAYAAFTAPAAPAQQAEGAADPSATKPNTSKPNAPKRGPGMMDRMEDRWRKRTEGDPQ